MKSLGFKNPYNLLHSQATPTKGGVLALGKIWRPDFATARSRRKFSAPLLSTICLINRLRERHSGTSNASVRVSLVCSRRSMDRTSACGADNVGSIPTESTRTKRRHLVCLLLVFGINRTGGGRGTEVPRGGRSGKTVGFPEVRSEASYREH